MECLNMNIQLKAVLFSVVFVSMLPLTAMDWTREELDRITIRAGSRSVRQTEIPHISTITVDVGDIHVPRTGDVGVLDYRNITTRKKLGVPLNDLPYNAKHTEDEDRQLPLKNNLAFGTRNFI